VPPYWSVEVGSEEMARPRLPAARNSAPPRGTNHRRAAPRASIALETAFAWALRGCSGSAGGRSSHAAATTSVSGRGSGLVVSPEDDPADASRLRMPDLQASSTCVWMRNQGLERRCRHRFPGGTIQNYYYWGKRARSFRTIIAITPWASRPRGRRSWSTRCGKSGNSPSIGPGTVLWGLYHLAVCWRRPETSRIGSIQGIHSLSARPSFGIHFSGCATGVSSSALTQKSTCESSDDITARWSPRRPWYGQSSRASLC
jgi:hypothetical protein